MDENAGCGRGVGFADGGTVPACALAVKLFEHPLVGFAGPFECCTEFSLIDFVVVVDEDVSLLEGVCVVGWWIQLMRMPC